MVEGRHFRAVVVGAGPAGLAVAAMLERRGVDAVVLERDAIAASWRRHYDRLRLHTHRRLSSLPGYRFSPRRGAWVARDGVVAYLEGYARHHRLDVRTGIEVRSIDKAPGGWRLDTSHGRLDASAVVVATGFNCVPSTPDWPGVGTFTGDLTHSSAYRDPGRFAGQDVLVVGTGNTGAELAADLAEHGARRVRVAVRTPPQVLLRDVVGFPTQATGILLQRLPTAVTDPMARLVRRATVGDLARHGLPAPTDGVFSDFRRRGVVPILDVGFVAALKRGQLEVVPAVRAFDGGRVVLADGSAIQPDAVIAATGYRRGLEPLVGHLGVLEDDGRPRHHGGAADPSAPGLHFIGYRNPLSGMFREIAFEARRTARAIDRATG